MTVLRPFHLGLDACNSDIGTPKSPHHVETLGPLQSSRGTDSLPSTFIFKHGGCSLSGGWGGSIQVLTEKGFGEVPVALETMFPSVHEDISTLPDRPSTNRVNELLGELDYYVGRLRRRCYSDDEVLLWCEVVVKTLVETWFKDDGASKKISSYEDVRFRSDTAWYKRAPRALNVRVHTGVPYTHTSNPLCERQSRVFRQCMRILLKREKTSDWVKLIPWLHMSCSMALLRGIFMPHILSPLTPALASGFVTCRPWPTKHET